MNRHALRSALGRAGPSSHRAAAAAASTRPTPPTTALSTPTPLSFFSTTPTAASSSSGPSKPPSYNPRSTAQTAAVQRLAKLNTAPANSSNNANKSASTFIGGFPTPAGSNTSSNPSGAPRVLNVRSLRGGLRSRGGGGGGGGGGFGAGFSGAPGEGSGPSGFVRRPVRFAGAGAGGGAGGAAGGARGGRKKFGLGGGGSARGRGRAGRGRKFGKKKEEEGKDEREGMELKWNREEREVVNRIEQGVVVPFEPSVTVESLTGFGAAVATDAGIGQVETLLRTMRLMTGGVAFNSDVGVTADVTEVMKRYGEKKPIFMHSKAEKAWIESAQPRLRVAPPDAGTKKAIVDAAILGKYPTASFAEAGDIRATMANYHGRTFTYLASDSQKFVDKVLSLLPAQGEAKPAAPARK